MDGSTGIRNGRRQAVRSANERWKGRWGAVRFWSAASTVAVHCAAFALWPLQEAQSPDPDAAPATLQLVRLAYPQSAPDATDGAVTLLREPDEVEPRPEPAADEPLDPIAALDRPLPALAVPSAPVFLPHTDPVAEIRRTHAATALLEPAPATASFAWPEIRNPRAIVRYLRTRYNALHREAAPDRFVSVAMWINDRGAVEWSGVHESSGDPVVDEIALTVVNEVFQFIPASRHGVPISVAVVLSIPFQVPW
jgi:TonB family protein